MQQLLQSIRRPAAIGLFGSIVAGILAVAFIYLAPWRFYPSAHTARWMLIAGSVLAVLAVSMTLLTVRRQVPVIRQLESLEAKLTAYAAYVRSIYLTMLAVIVILCAFTLFSAHNVLLMLAIVALLVLFLNYPNPLRIKIDLGLTDEEFNSLFPHLKDL